MLKFVSIIKMMKILKNLIRLCFASCLVLCVLSCEAPKKKPATTQVDYLELVKGLSSTEAKVGYLQGIETLDEQARKAERDAMSTHGYNSNQHQSAKKELQKAEAFNIEKIEAYLKVWGYPEKEILKTNAADMPIKVIHESNDLNVKRRNFKYLHTAYRNKLLVGSLFSRYLNKYYEMSKGERMNIPNPYSEDFEIDTLLRSMRLK